MMMSGGKKSSPLAVVDVMGRRRFGVSADDPVLARQERPDSCQRPAPVCTCVQLFALSCRVFGTFKKNGKESNRTATIFSPSQTKKVKEKITSRS